MLQHTNYSCYVAIDTISWEYRTLSNLGLLEYYYLKLLKFLKKVQM